MVYLIINNFTAFIFSLCVEISFECLIWARVADFGKSPEKEENNMKGKLT